MKQRRKLPPQTLRFVVLMSIAILHGALSFSQSPRRIEESIEIGIDGDSGRGLSLFMPANCCTCIPSPCSTAGSSITMPYEGKVWVEITGSEAGAPIAFGLESPYHEHYWDNATQHVGEDTLIGYFGQNTNLLFHIHPGGPCASYVMYPRVFGSAPIWTLRFEDYWDCDWNDLVVEVRLCECDTCGLQIDLNIQGGGSPQINLIGSRNLIASVVGSGCVPVDSTRLEFDVSRLYSGGHIHNGDPPVGIVSPDTGITDQNGRLVTTYTAPVETCLSPSLPRGIAGQYIVRVSSPDSPGDLSDTLHIQNRLPTTLDTLDDNAALWLKVGRLPVHPNSHYGTTNSSQDLIDIAVKYDSTMEARFEDHDPVRYNDRSLVWGGLFDIGANWTCPHRAHYYGRNCDITKFLTLRQDTVLGRIIQEYGDTLIPPHPDHWHVTFPQ